MTNCHRADVFGMFSIDPFSLNAQDLCSKRVKVEEAFSSPSLKGETFVCGRDGGAESDNTRVCSQV